MSLQPARDTGPEVRLRRVLHRAGWRYRVHVRPLESKRVEADIVFRGPRVAVFVDGCFWHVCPEHATWPKAHAAFWKRKLESNFARDRATDAALREAGWLAVRVWEHEKVDAAAARVTSMLRTRTAKRRSKES
jgi:DNA mismatch endonuclease (patch repair protein)